MDIDIDLPKHINLKDIFPDVVIASRVEQDELISHPSGVYFQNIDSDEVSGLSAIPYKIADEMGFFKFDFLKVNALDDFTSHDEIVQLSSMEPDWSLLNNKYLVSKLFHISNHYDLIQSVKPTSILEISDILALMRPNKIKLLEKYIRNRQATRIELYTRPETKPI